MKPSIKTTLACALAGVYTVPLHAASLAVEVELPRIEVAEYHRPYVAVWLQSADRQTVRDIAVWYDYKMPKEEGKKWLKDLRQWWRVSGRGQDELADGITGATQAPGKHTIQVAATHPALAGLPAGEYEVIVEASREKGGREVLRLPLAWPAQQAATAEAQGESELGHVKATLTP
ncbi:DUF2271 domain-containing protein [Pusillimonas noertemannii]|uniref:DUF2271 domain-containing protein n=1 Tax=Pusillimonas noertemannii TaxID=305977 RepID=A0A2U1CNP9_9BURK|nr:DUF2271 domain-containing protein [Pusillimonas noertemannii]NYT68345.1 DUF2271 domain-containing protein [Pusillimonas noertemannii]PVY62640.1 hypothetical protein C7440_2135 [Pusillimonas noertemannii]